MLNYIVPIIKKYILWSEFIFCPQQGYKNPEGRDHTMIL